MIQLYIWPTTDRQVVASNFRVAEVAQFLAREPVQVSETSPMIQIRRKEENLVPNTPLRPFWNKNAPFYAFRTAFCSIGMFSPQK